VRESGNYDLGVQKVAKAFEVRSPDARGPIREVKSVNTNQNSG